MDIDLPGRSPMSATVSAIDPIEGDSTAPRRLAYLK
jgi:hypothetical protein